MTAVGFALMNATLAAAFTVALRIGLRRVPDAEVGTLVIVVMGVLVGLAAAFVFGFDSDEFALDQLWPFFVAGAATLGAGQLLYAHGVRLAGASRPAVVVAVAPLISALAAIVLLNEPFSVALGVGTVLIVAGGIAIGWERSRPVDFKLLGVVLALTSAVFFSTRDVLVRWASDGTIVSPRVAMVAAFVAGAITLLAYLLLSSGPRRAAVRFRLAFPHFIGAGVILGFAQVAIFEALSRGPVTVVVPLIGTHALWTVLLAAVVLRQAEAVSARVVVAAILVVCGGIIVGVVRSPDSEAAVRTAVQVSLVQSELASASGSDALPDRSAVEKGRTRLGKFQAR